MKYLIFIALFFTSLTAQTPLKVLSPVSYVSPKEFSGLWYEIARTYNSYQEKCVAASVEYKLLEPLEYEVFNRCFDSKIGGKLIEYTGVAQPKEGESMSSIDMTYYWIFTKNYNVYYIEKDYSYAVVGDKNFEQVWIMSRKPQMPQEKLNKILDYLSSAMDTKSFIYTPQDTQGRYK